MSFLKNIFGSRNDRILRSMNKVVVKINNLEESMKKLSDEALAAKTVEFRDRLAKGVKLNSLLPEAFAVVRETSCRVMNMRHFDVQLIGGMVLHDGNIAEMRTGEGKTLCSTLAIYLNALPGKGVHVVTVNDYLAQRDADWMRPIYEFLGLTVGVNKAYEEEPEKKKEAYAADITYGTNNEFGFDYLRDNMAFSLEDKVQRELVFAVIDEVDSILIDEARTPLIISGPADDSSELYIKMNQIVPRLTKQEEEEGPGDYSLDEKQKQAHLTEDGHQKVEDALLEFGVLKEGESLYDAGNIIMMHHLNAALRAHTLYHRDVDYIVRNDEVIIVDEHTGRLMAGRRWSDGLHQAVEAKEEVSIQGENQTMASITFQNYFRLYEKLSGMTGTADTEAYEFHEIYHLEVVVIPTNKPMVRQDNKDKVYVNGTDKFQAIIDDIRDCQKRKQPILVGTIAIETSEQLSNVLNKENIAHQVLNAKFHEQEAKIVAQAGKPGAVTIATNMAGRGTDIVLGGNLEVAISELGEADAANEDKIKELRQQWQQAHQEILAAGGLRIIGTERHESRRIDNQLRGRAGRQGDPGSSQFYLSLEDSLMRIFASEKISGIMKRGLSEGEALESGMVSKVIEMAQRKVEGHNFDIRKQLLEYDDVANDQRTVIYQQRNELLEQDNVSETIRELLHDVINNLYRTYIPQDSMEEQWDVVGLEKELRDDFGFDISLQNLLESDEGLHEETLEHHIRDIVEKTLRDKEEKFGEDVMRHIEKSAMLQCLDTRWREHLIIMDYLRQGIHLRGYAQQNPKEEYKREGFHLFSRMLNAVKQDIIALLLTVEIEQEADVLDFDEERRRMTGLAGMQYSHAELTALQAADEEAEAMLAMGGTTSVVPFNRDQPKVGRNDPCPCGSGKKYKHCHGHD